MKERGERRGAGGCDDHFKGSSGEPLKLEDLGVTKKQSNDWQKLASLDTGAFEKRVGDAKRQAVKSVEMTADGFMARRMRGLSAIRGRARGRCIEGGRNEALIYIVFGETLWLPPAPSSQLTI
jgi:hypothetical protein